MKIIPIIFIAVIPTFVWADDLYTNNIVNGCGDAYYYAAEFEPISYTCLSGQFLPAGAISCQTCPQTYTCNGGTFTFNANQTQGLSGGDILVTDAIGSCSPQFNQSFSAVFEPITYTCSAGYYLPADAEGCIECPANNYCQGGTYTFNETVPQGLNPCPNNTPHSPAGSTSEQQCHAAIITITWTGATQAAIDANNAGTTTYGGDIRTPQSAIQLPGQTFIGWRFIKPTPTQQPSE